ncbi:hypothetical protein L2735_09955 [Shewanella olleyana]|uniref:hypothetical protein n=1 Tax=Shewanella olleyana TaxID=135626 RepID=UPI00200D3C0D|nr:hypothetical protein [Shewanella olleyana]MCL1067130.1 hypothetical protein [Shewanella olleyana]
MKSSNITVLAILILGLLVLAGCSEQSENASKEDAAEVSAVKEVDNIKPVNSKKIQCDMTYFSEIESLISSGDGQGHGPDLGSEEWKSVIEFKLGVRGKAEVPARDTPVWCEYIKSKIETSY